MLLLYRPAYCDTLYTFGSALHQSKNKIYSFLARGDTQHGIGTKPQRGDSLKERVQPFR